MGSRSLAPSRGEGGAGARSAAMATPPEKTSGRKVAYSLSSGSMPSRRSARINRSVDEHEPISPRLGVSHARGGKTAVRRQLENVLEEPQPEANEAEAKAAERAAKAAKRREENKEAADGSDDDVLERAYRYEVNECNEMLRKRCAPTYECNGAVTAKACAAGR